MSKFTADLEKYLEAYAGKIESTIQAAQDLPELGHLYKGIEPGRLRVDIPLTPNAYAEYREALGGNWRQRSGYSQGCQNDVGDTYWYFQHKKLSIKLTLCLDSTSEYATCKRVKIGVKEVAIFETVCS